MKAKLVILLLLNVFVASCEKDVESTIELSQTDFRNISYEQTSLEVEIQATQEWTATSMVSWCKLSQEKGSGNAKLTLKIDPNLEDDRTGTVVIWSPQGVIRISLQQVALPDGQEYLYKIPVIFHVLYKDKESDKQYVPQARLAEILNNINSLYRGQTIYKDGNNGVDMNVEFTLATEDEQGNALAAPGVNYIEMDNMPIDCESFMSDSRYVKLLWDPNQYINVMIYNFATVDQGNSIILGISHLPLSVAGENYLEGLPQTTYPYLTKENLSYPKCVSINSLYIYEEASDAARYNSMNVNTTLAHELGHYLGLYHAFDEDETGLSTQCINSDYCNDTPSYNRIAYELYLQALLSEASQAGGSVSLAEAVKRENCKTGEIFNSYNLMDYEIGYSDRFSNDQRKRTRHVLTYSPLTPGPKKGKAATRNAINGPLDLPMVIVK